MSELRQVQESPLIQGEDEKITYNLTVTPWGSDPSAVSVVAYDVTGGDRTVVTDTVLVGSASVAGDVITLPSVENLTPGHIYRLEIQWVSGGNTFECYVIIEAEQ